MADLSLSEKICVFLLPEGRTCGERHNLGTSKYLRVTAGLWCLEWCSRGRRSLQLPRCPCKGKQPKELGVL